MERWDGLGTTTIDHAHDLVESYDEAGCPLSNSTATPPPTHFCTADRGDCPCGNGSLLSGCANATGTGARLDASGSSSVADDDLVLVPTQLPPNTTVLSLVADALRHDVFMNGLLCVGGPTSKICGLPPIVSSNGDGVVTFRHGLVALSNTPQVPIVGGIVPGDTWYFQTFYRDMGPCGTGANTSNAIGVTFVL